jgi:hypothetical protein
MTRSTNARIAGFTYLFYTAVGSTLHFLMNRATNAEGTAATLARIAGHAADLRIAVLLSLLETFSALVLAVTMYGITRVEDHELAMLALLCRVCEGMIGATIGIPLKLGLLWLATAGAGPGHPDASTVNVLSAFLLMPVPTIPIGTIFFAVGSALFSYLLLRGRMVPLPLAWFGVLASILLVVVIPPQLAGFTNGAWYLWIPMAVYQVALALWLLIKGVTTARAA